MSVGGTSRPKFNCVFCGKHNQSHTCWNVATLEERRAFFLTYKICFSCGKQHFGDCHAANDVVCAWPHCGAKGNHNSALCPNVAYPITIGHVLALRASQSVPATYQNPEGVKKEVIFCCVSIFLVTNTHHGKIRGNSIVWENFNF